MIILCSVALILACNLLTPVTVCAEGTECSHTFNATVTVVRSEFQYSHQYVIKNGPNGPVYGTCYVYKYYEDSYPRCTKCGYVDEGNLLGTVYTSTKHSDCKQ